MTVNDLTDEFDTRLAALEKSRVPRDEIDAQITVYERARSARAICQALFPDGFTSADVVALVAEIGRAKHSGQAVKTRE